MKKNYSFYCCVLYFPLLKKNENMSALLPTKAAFTLKIYKNKIMEIVLNFWSKVILPNKVVKTKKR